VAEHRGAELISDTPRRTGAADASSNVAGVIDEQDLVGVAAAEAPGLDCSDEDDFAIGVQPERNPLSQFVKHQASVPRSS